MDEVIVVTSAKEAEGIGVFDLKTGSAACSTFKNCACEASGELMIDDRLVCVRSITPSLSLVICSVGGGSSFCGHGSSGDYLVASQSKKPQLTVWQWGKPQASCSYSNIIQYIDNWCTLLNPLGSYAVSCSRNINCSCL